MPDFFLARSSQFLLVAWRLNGDDKTLVKPQRVFFFVFFQVKKMIHDVLIGVLQMCR